MQANAKTFQASFIVKLVLELLILWYLDAVSAILRGTYSIVLVISDMFALPVLFKTLLLPYRVENRKGFVAIAIGIGFFLRIISIFACLSLITLVIIVGLVAAFGWVLLPILFLYLLFRPLLP